jgi:hypothetical protein
MRLSQVLMGVVGLLAFSGPVHSQVDNSFFSGFEVFPGVRFNHTTVGASFAGWTNDSQQAGISGGENCEPSSGDWTSISHSTGGALHGSVNYRGRPGFGRTVQITGGQWYWLEDDHTAHHGRVLKGGAVTWPPGPNSTIGPANLCGCGVAQLTIPISLGHSSLQAGTITGCLNDQLVFPPRIWGEVNLTAAP